MYNLDMMQYDISLRIFFLNSFSQCVQNIRKTYSAAHEISSLLACGDSNLCILVHNGNRRKRFAFLHMLSDNCNLLVSCTRRVHKRMRILRRKTLKTSRDGRMKFNLEIVQFIPFCIFVSLFEYRRISAENSNRILGISIVRKYSYVY